MKNDGNKTKCSRKTNKKRFYEHQVDKRNHFIRTATAHRPWYFLYGKQVDVTIFAIAILKRALFA